ncbi:MAG: NFACT family protein, partial [Candidatus Eremiobacteraeota bacterium]|nr:NFACT family protein [Candidatus Eremiobacteraeota bacterium]
MVTDWLLVRRLGYELETRLRGARVGDVGRLADGRFGVLLRRHRESRLLAVDPFASPPIVTVESGELGIAAEPGFVRAAASTLGGTVLTQVRSRRGDRLLKLTFSLRSRFGVDDAAELFLELVPRFGNIILVKRETVVAAAKEFSPAENGRRSVLAGQLYAPPPLPPDAPQVPKLIAATGISREALLAFAESDAPLHDPLYVYRLQGRLLQAHVVALDGFSEAICTREPCLVDVLAELRRQKHEGLERDRQERLRAGVLKRLGERDRHVQAELAALEGRRRDAAQRDTLRLEGESIFATLHALTQDQRAQAKERAAKLFARYRKLGAALPHIERRERELRSQAVALEALGWEAERVATEDLADLDATVAGLGRRATRSTPPRRRRKRPPF